MARAAAAVLGAMWVVWVMACAPRCPQLAEAPAFANQPLGGPCLTAADCESGLECLPWAEGTSLCSRPCSPSAACAQGQCVLAADGGAGLCLAPCLADGGCATGVLASVCGGTSCHPSFCVADEGCPASSRCAGATCSQVSNGGSEGVAIEGGRCFHK